jgi:hypothetical protein
VESLAFGILSNCLSLRLGPGGGGGRAWLQFAGPVVDPGAQFGCLRGTDRHVGVGEAVDGGEHVREDLAIEPSVVFCGPLEQAVAAVTLGEVVDVGEVSGFGAAEQGQGLAGGQVARAERGTKLRTIYLLGGGAVAA